MIVSVRRPHAPGHRPSGFCLTGNFVRDSLVLADRRAEDLAAHESLIAEIRSLLAGNRPLPRCRLTQRRG